MFQLFEIEEKKVPNYMKYVLGGSAGMLGILFVQPMDLVKTRLQVDTGSGTKEYNGAFDCAKKVLTKEGIFAFYNGVGAALLRQATYTTARMGIYQTCNDNYRHKYGKGPGPGASMVFGLAAGAVGAFVGTPADLALIRMMSDKKLPEAERRNYKHVFDALGRIVKEEGVFNLWRGCTPTVGRAMIVNMVQLASYSQMKAFFSKFFSGLPLHIASAMMSGFLTTCASMPMDLAKTRIQNMKIVNGKPEFSGSLDVLMKVIKVDGIFALWKGFGPYLGRLGPHTIFAFVFLEQLTKAYYYFVLGEESRSSSM